MVMEDIATSNKKILMDSLDNIQKEGEWFQLATEGPAPDPRSKHGAIRVGRKIFIMGGASAKGALNDVLVLHVEKCLWLVWDPGSLQTPLQGLPIAQRGPQCIGHTLAFWDKKLVVVGGQTDSTMQNLQVHSLDLESDKWSLLIPNGDIPMKRSGETIIQVGSMLVLFGGEDRSGRLFNDAYIFDLKSNVWLALRTTGSKPSPRRDHCSSCFSGRFLWVFGGKTKAAYLNDLYCLDLQTMEWTHHQAKGLIPAPRAGHVGVISGRTWYIIGGEFRGNEVLDMLAINLVSHVWSPATRVQPGSPLANDGISVVKTSHEGRSYIVAFGGHGAILCNQVYVMLLPLSSGNVPYPKLMDSISRKPSFNTSISTSFLGPMNHKAKRIEASQKNAGTVSSRNHIGHPTTRNSCELEADPVPLTDNKISEAYANGSIPDDIHKEDRVVSQDGAIRHAPNHQEKDLVQDQKGSIITETGTLHTTAKHHSGSSNEDIEMEQPGIEDKDVQCRTFSKCNNSCKCLCISAEKDLQERIQRSMIIIEDSNVRLAEGLSGRSDCEKALGLALTGKEEAEKRLNEALSSISELKGLVSEFQESNACLENRLEAAISSLEEHKQRLLKTSLLQGEAEMKLRSTLKLKEAAEKRLSKQSTTIEELEKASTAWHAERRENMELKKRVQDLVRQLELSTSQQGQAERKLMASFKEKTDLKKKTIKALHIREDTHAHLVAANAENLHLQRDLLILKSTLADFQKELHAKDEELIEAQKCKFELQAELFDMKKNLRR